MKHLGQKTIFVAGALVAAAVCSLMGAHAQNPATGQEQISEQDGVQSGMQNPAAAKSEGKPKTATEQFKNIQILKDMPADQLIPAMQFMTASLGVDCEYC